MSGVRDLDLDRRVLRALNRPGSVRDVAIELGHDPGAVSRAMRRLRGLSLVRTVRSGRAARQACSPPISGRSKYSDASSANAAEKASSPART